MYNYARIQAAGHLFEVNAGGWASSGRWGHESELLKDGARVASNTIRYYNRTWEGRQYQTAARSCVYSYLQDLMDQAVAAFKARTGCKRLKGFEKKRIARETYPEFSPLEDFMYSL